MMKRRRKEEKKKKEESLFQMNGKLFHSRKTPRQMLMIMKQST